MKKIRNFLDCIYIYPAIVVLTFLVLFIIFARYLSVESSRYVVQNTIESLQQRSYMIKALTEEYSFTKNSALLSKEMQKIASNDKGLDIYMRLHKMV